MLTSADGRLFLGDCRAGNPVHFPYRVTSLLCWDMGFECRDLICPDVNRLPFFQAIAHKECGAETLKFNNPFSAELLDNKTDASFVLRHGLRIEFLGCTHIASWE